MSDITITLHDPSTGRSESMPVSDTLTVQEVVDLGKALLGLDGGGSNGGSNIVATIDGRPLVPPTQTLAEAGVKSGDLLAFRRTRPARSAAAAAPAAAGGGLDFSGLLSGGSAPPSPAPGGGLDFSSLLAGNLAGSGNPSNPPAAVYYPGMSFEEAVHSNPHPKTIVRLLQDHTHLFKEFNYHMPTLARKIREAPNHDEAVEIWRKEMVNNSIRSAAATSQTFHKERAFRLRLQRNPDDAEAREYFENKESQALVNDHYRRAIQEYPESMGRVLMLYINAKINHHPLQAFVDSGAQQTIMSKRCARKCGIFHLLDTRFSGIAVGVGTGKILGRIHIVQLQIGDYHFPCSITIMDDAALPTSGNSAGEKTATPKDMDLLLGLDMLKRFNCSIDLMEGKLKFNLGGSTLETPFLHEKDLDQSNGGTKGFDATKANRELEDAQRKHREALEQKASQPTNDGGGVDDEKNKTKDDGGGDAMQE
eukprot:CAMPEP_0201269408 /NCGR_PEP_ID=MMETSP0853-20130426/32570_1 /ASSEMBLY_ACC=CAM_ASM_000640 /TAXON_ID=183588 /ORGANISM="Pseudo-nitzschia fraudulenta, Strain WWA7" /LENGTH=478 /DNA_ID=CAMNT_0047575407 /DNA_START=44 /DNA_END=1480 /DNA_ORIENTATION=-